jgi:2-oxoglutarate ferredoxin oxidoreductase subunit gamma
MGVEETRILIAGFGGQGVVLAGQVLALASIVEGKNVTGMVSYGAEMRGGTANSTVVISEDPIASPVVEKPNAAIILNQPSLDKFQDKITPGGLVVVNSTLVNGEVARDDLKVVKVAASETAEKLGNTRVANIVALGAFVKSSGIVKLSSVEEGILETFTGRKANFAEINKQALAAGAGGILE